MLVSRGVVALRAARALSKNGGTCQQVIRHHAHASWGYRKGPAPASKRLHFFADVTQGFMWWWILWHLWTEPDHILGEFEYPDARKWTDEELGIPDEIKLD